MKLELSQDAIQRICFSREPSEEDLDAVGNRARWLLYRNMVRARLRRVCRVALPRTLEAAGEVRFDAWVDEWFAERAPRTRYFWRVVAEFAEYTRAKAAIEPLWLQELMRYEALHWHTRHDEGAPDAEILPIDFERVPFVNPTLTLLELAHAVHRPLAEGQASYPEEPTHLALFRRIEDDDTVTWSLNPMGAALVARWQLEQETLKQAVVAVAEARNATLNASFLDSLAGLLEGLLERGLLLGSRR